MSIETNPEDIEQIRERIRKSVASVQGHRLAIASEPTTRQLIGFFREELSL